MLFLDTSGYGYSKSLCRDVIFWFVSKYLSKYKLDIEVIHRGLKREGVVGWASVCDCDWNPRCFLIEIQSGLNFEDYVLCLCHELEHILQHVRGDLRDKRGIRCWKGVDCSGLDYSEQPWEQEADRREKELYEQYLSYLNNNT
jgi:hypothetical protein